VATLVAAARRPSLCIASAANQAVKTFEELKLWNDMIFVDVPKHRHFICSQCGGRNIKVMPIFPPPGTPGYRSGA
jgi:hypothetical protein